MYIGGKREVGGKMRSRKERRIDGRGVKRHYSRGRKNLNV